MPVGTDGPADSMVERLRRSGPAPPPSGRRTSWIAAGLVIAAVVLVAAAVAWDLTHDARLGPDPTVASSDSCGGGVPSAVLAFDARTGDQRWSALTGASSNLVMGDRTLVVDDGATFRGLAVDEGEARWCDVLDPTKVRGIRPIGSAGALLYVEADRLVLRADADGADGAERWSIPGGFEVVTSDDHVVLVADLDTNDGARRVFRGLDVTTGEERWSFERPRGPEVESYPP